MEKLRNLRKILDGPAQVQLPAQTMVVKTERSCPAGPAEDGFIQLEDGRGATQNPRFTLLDIPVLSSDLIISSVAAPPARRD